MTSIINKLNREIWRYKSKKKTCPLFEYCALLFAIIIIIIIIIKMII